MLFRPGPLQGTWRCRRRQPQALHPLGEGGGHGEGARQPGAVQAPVTEAFGLARQDRELQARDLGQLLGHLELGQAIWALPMVNSAQIPRHETLQQEAQHRGDVAGPGGIPRLTIVELPPSVLQVLKQT